MSFFKFDIREVEIVSEEETKKKIRKLEEEKQKLEKDFARHFSDGHGFYGTSWTLKKNIDQVDRKIRETREKRRD